MKRVLFFILFFMLYGLLCSNISMDKPSFKEGRDTLSQYPDNTIPRKHKEVNPNLIFQLSSNNKEETTGYNPNFLLKKCGKADTHILVATCKPAILLTRGQGRIFIFTRKIRI